MKKIDLKSFLIGVLSICCSVLFFGAGENITPQDIVATSITIVDKEGQGVAYLGSIPDVGGGGLMLGNQNGDPVVSLGSNGKRNGELNFFNDIGNQTVFLGTSSDGAGRLTVYNLDSKQNVFIGSKTGNGFIATTNASGETTGGIPSN